jgi:HPt (histidine-containing phosphotransfer) domain-containing protein
MTSRKAINLPPISAEAMAKYVARRKLDLEALRAAIASGSSNLITQEFRRIGHQLKGNGATFGFPELESLGHDLEAESRQYNPSNSERLLRFLEQWIVAKSEQFTRPGP